MMAGTDGAQNNTSVDFKELSRARRFYGLQRLQFQDGLEMMKRKYQEQGKEPVTSPLAGFKRSIDGTFEVVRDLLCIAFGNPYDNSVDIKKRWFGSAELEDMRMLAPWDDVGNEIVSALIASIQESASQNRHVPLETIQALYRDPEANMGLSRTNNRWLSIGWFSRDAYSPVRLEADPDLGEDGTKWRRAFEDLMNASLGKPMGSKDCVITRLPYGRPQSTHYGPGLDWMFSLQSRGILPPLLPNHFSRCPERPVDLKRDPDFQSLCAALAIRNPADAHHESDTRVKAQHELEMYQALLKDLAEDNQKKLHAAREAEEDEKRNDHVTLTPERVSHDKDTPKSETPVHSNDGQPAHTRSGLFLTGDQQEDFEDANDAFWEALWAKDAESASKILSDWHKMYDSVEDLVDAPWQNFLRTSGLAPTSEWFSVLTEALRKSELPEDDVHRDSAFAAHTEHLERVDRLSLEEKRRRYDIRKRVAELLSDAMNEEVSAQLTRASTKDLEEFLEGLEQENANFEAMFSGGSAHHAQQDSDRTSPEPEPPRAVAEPKKPEDRQPQKPDILSILSTTQTIRLPDGTVTTKVVLKKRFADGREESTESTHTRNELAEENARKQSEDEKQEEKKKEQGWFWS